MARSGWRVADRVTEGETSGVQGAGGLLLILCIMQARVASTWACIAEWQLVFRVQ